MCGILGVSGSVFASTTPKDFYDALDLIRHRGPDGANVIEKSKLRLGHTRLSVIDLDQRSSQPMQIKELTIVFNGEIYNYKELHAELMALGYSFNTSSDTEVFLNSWHQWGSDCLKRLEGMFAFGLWDEKKDKLYLGRDKYGEKPLFIFEEENGISFSSEIPPLVRLCRGSLQEDKKSIGLFFLYSYIPAPFSGLKGVTQVEPGWLLEWSQTNGLEYTQYYNLKTEINISSITKIQPSYSDACDILKLMLDEIVQKRVITADVPVATFLSGGIDSSIITILAAKWSDRKVSTYSLGFPKDPNFDETDYAKSVTALLPNVKHEIVEATEDSVLDYAGTVLDKLGEPFADASLLPTSLLCSEVKEKVVLGGDAADEIFAGYGVYPAILAGNRLPSIFRKLLEQLPRHHNPAEIKNPILRRAALFQSHLKHTSLETYLSWRHYANVQTLSNLGLDISSATNFENNFQENKLSNLKDIQVLDLIFNLPNDMLKKVDYAAMFCGLEVRLPFLDSNLVHWALNLPDKYKLNSRSRKRILRDAFSDILPEKVINRNKMGFLLPIRNWFRNGKLHDELQAMLKEQTVLDVNTAQTILIEHSLGKADHSVLLWSMYVYLRWLAMLPIWSNHSSDYRKYVN